MVWAGKEECRGGVGLGQGTLSMCHWLRPLPSLGLGSLSLQGVWEGPGQVSQVATS